MDLLCVLVAIPECIIFYPIVIFLLEYKKMKDAHQAAVQKRLTEDTNDHTEPLPEFKPSALIGPVILRVVTNPIIWAMVVGFICNFAVTSYYTFFTTTVKYLAQTAYAICMFNMGLYLFAIFHSCLTVFCISSGSLYLFICHTPSSLSLSLSLSISLSLPDFIVLSFTAPFYCHYVDLGRHSHN